MADIIIPPENERIHTEQVTTTRVERDAVGTPADSVVITDSPTRNWQILAIVLAALVMVLAIWVIAASRDGSTDVAEINRSAMVATRRTVIVPSSVAVSSSVPVPSTVVVPSSVAIAVPATSVPVQPAPVATRDPQAQRVSLYYYNAKSDPQTTCSASAVLPVPREIPISSSPLAETVRLLLAGNISSSEAAEGFTTEYPLPGLELVSADIRDNVATLTFDDPNNVTGGGSCRVQLLRYQVEKTAQQFPNVRSVRILPDTLFQP